MITIFENGKYILHLPDWANNVYLKLEDIPFRASRDAETPYNDFLSVLKISYRDKESYCLYHPTIKRHSPWVDSMEELDKRYTEGEIDFLYGLTVYSHDMWGDPIPIKIYLEEDEHFRYRCEVDWKLKYIDFLQTIFKRLRWDYPLVNWDFVHFQGKFVSWV